METLIVCEYKLSNNGRTKEIRFLIDELFYCRQHIWGINERNDDYYGIYKFYNNCEE